MHDGEGLADDKIRLRSDIELLAQAHGLEKLCDVLVRVGVAHLLSGGTLLGAAREGDFIRWDWDVELSVLTEDIEGRLDEIIHHVEREGFAVLVRDDSPDNRKLVLEHDGAVYELQAYRSEGRWRTRREYRTEQRFFDEAGSIELRGRSYPCMGPVDAYLTDRYGDWRTPLRTADKSAYLNPAYFRRPGWVRQLETLRVALFRRLRGTSSDEPSGTGA